MVSIVPHMQLSIIILSFNTESLLKDCLKSIELQLKKFSYEMIVLDNNSNDNSVKMIKKDFSKVRLIDSSINLGFAKGVNLATKEARGKYLLLLNSDAFLTDSSVKDIIDYMEKDNEAGIVGGQLVDKNGIPERSFGEFYTLPVVFRMLLIGEKAETFKERYNYIKKVGWVSGGFMMIRREIFIELNGFDENFFMYIEDMELCYRARKIGYDTYFFPTIKAIHLSQGSSSRSFAIKYIYKGLLYFYKKHRSFMEYLILKFLLWSKAILLIIIGLITGNSYLKKTYMEAIKF